MLSKGVLLLHDIARSHTCLTTRELIESFGWEVLGHALYSPNLSPSEFHLFLCLKHSLSGKCFSDNEEGKAAMNSWPPGPAADFFEEGFQNLVLSYFFKTNGPYLKNSPRIPSAIRFVPDGPIIPVPLPPTELQKISTFLRSQVDRGNLCWSRYSQANEG
ncbi:uncharacterized protein TNCV_4587241 [Trichonephila clavipes]|nr:uncharacterized protein TNCV_4587241 [Trichonephila clavipes]